MKLLTCTAFGAPLVPEVKISMNVSNVPVSRGARTSPACAATSSAHSADPVSTTRTPGSSTPASSGRCRASVSSTWQSAVATSAASAAPRRVRLIPAVTWPPSAPADSANAISGVLSSSTPTCGGPRAVEHRRERVRPRRRLGDDLAPGPHAVAEPQPGRVVRRPRLEVLPHRVHQASRPFAIVFSTTVSRRAPAGQPA
jgi:hypothetical protein